MKLNKQTATWRQQRLFIENLSIGMCLRACMVVKRSIFLLVILSINCSNMIAAFVMHACLSDILAVVKMLYGFQGKCFFYLAISLLWFLTMINDNNKPVKRFKATMANQWQLCGRSIVIITIIETVNKATQRNK